MRRSFRHEGSRQTRQVLDRVSERAGWGAPRELRRPASVMSDHFDINGSIWLSDTLAPMDPPAQPMDAELQASILDQALPLAERVKTRVAAIRRMITRRYASFRGGSPGVGDADEAHALLEGLGILRRPSKKSIGRAAAALVGPHGPVFERALASARAELIFVRDDLGNDLRAMGAEAAELVRIDTAISRAILLSTRAQTQRLYTALDHGLQAALTQAITELPRTPASSPELREALADWFSPQGLILRHVDDCEELALTLFDRDGALLTTLVDAACDLAAAGGLS